MKVMANQIAFTNQEYAEMHLIYGEAKCNARRARRIYRERYPNRPTPSVDTFIRIHARLVERGMFDGGRGDRGRAILGHRNEEAILEYFEENPQSSVRMASREFNTSYTTIWRILKRQSLHPYHFRKMQDMLPEDFLKRVRFCRTLSDLIQQNVLDLNNVLWTDEALFTRMGMFNSHNMHLWAQENPHAKIVTHFQHKFTINVWVGIIGSHLIGPAILPRKLNGESYLNFLRNHLVELLEDLPLDLRRIMWFMQDGAPPHFTLAVRRYLNERFPRRWIGRGQEAPLQWPPRSPDLNPLDFFWGHIKNIVYATPIQNEAELLQRITNASNEIRNSREMMRSVIFNIHRRCLACINANGQHFEHLL